MLKSKVNSLSSLSFQYGHMYTFTVTNVPISWPKEENATFEKLMLIPNPVKSLVEPQKIKYIQGTHSVYAYHQHL